MIIGGGPAGTAAAIAIARAGRMVTLIERHAIPTDKVCGDFLSAEAVSMLATLGVDLSAASPIDTVRLVHRNRTATSPLPFTALGFTRRALDETLLQQASVSGAAVVRGQRVHAIRQDGRSLRLDCDVTSTDAVFLATGKHELRGTTRTERGTGWAALKMYYTLAPAQRDALRRHVELILFAGGYAGLQLVEADRAVLCILVSRARLHAAAGRWDRLLHALTDQSPHLRNRLTGARPLRERPLTIAGLPYGYVHKPESHDVPGLFRLGDQAAVIASLTGDGVALALTSGSLAAQTWLAGRTGAHYHERLAAGVARQMRFASAIHAACLKPAVQPWLTAGCRLWPRAIQMAAAATRVTGLTQNGPAA